MSRLLLTICCLLVLAIIGRRDEVPLPSAADNMAMAGFCSGDCASCGCPPALAASNNCCCTRTRQLRHPERLPTITVNAMPDSVSPYPLSLRCAPCKQAPVAVSAAGGDPLLLPSVNSFLPSPPVLVLACPPPILLPIGRGATAPPSPPPEIVV